MKITTTKIKVRGKLKYGDEIYLNLTKSLYKDNISGKYEFINKMKVKRKWEDGSCKVLHFYNREMGKDIYITNDQYQRSINNTQHIESWQWHGGL